MRSDLRKRSFLGCRGLTFVQRPGRRSRVRAVGLFEPIRCPTCSSRGTDCHPRRGRPLCRWSRRASVRTGSAERRRSAPRAGEATEDDVRVAGLCEYVRAGGLAPLSPGCQPRPGGPDRRRPRRVTAFSVRRAARRGTSPTTPRPLPGRKPGTSGLPPALSLGGGPGVRGRGKGRLGTRQGDACQVTSSAMLRPVSHRPRSRESATISCSWCCSSPLRRAFSRAFAAAGARTTYISMTMRLSVARKQ
ncbi:hypothetical protein QF030_003036 [Streptomyces rishiriensis]|uniref:Uncharacterized protein n=1 Tax=Streptomyces rishiriensis TaxID=68264 RepID=A0ABU0NQ11_STRRH|nr:hypothetical protein [Streptomyces rishiriensis]